VFPKIVAKNHQGPNRLTKDIIITVLLSEHGVNTFFVVLLCLN